MALYLKISKVALRVWDIIENIWQWGETVALCIRICSDEPSTAKIDAASRSGIRRVNQTTSQRRRPKAHALHIST